MWGGCWVEDVRGELMSDVWVEGRVGRCRGERMVRGIKEVRGEKM